MTAAPFASRTALGPILTAGSTVVGDGVAAAVGSPAHGGDIRITDREHWVEVTTELSGPYTGAATILDIEITSQEVVLHTMGGGAFENAYPAGAFAVTRRTIHPGLPQTYPARLSKIEFGGEHGLSSAAVMPFFLISGVGEAEGIWVAVGWSGSWGARLTKLTDDRGHRLEVTALGGDLVLEPGARVALPAVVVGGYTGDGWAAVRRYLRSIRPSASGGWAVYNSWFNEYGDVDAGSMIANIAVAAELGLDAVTLDGAWYETAGAERNDFHTVGFGTWEPDPVRFPDGIEPVAEAARSVGLRFGLWCEFERAHPASAVAAAHPEWLRRVDTETLALVDLGIPEARDWAVALLDGLIARWSLGWLKLDMTCHDFAAYFKGDALGELTHIRGLYSVLDEVRLRHQGLVIEGCASGGGRIDLEMIARCDTMWISDQTVNPELVRDTVANARRLLPAQYCYLSLAPQLPAPPDRFPDEWLVGVLPGVLGVMDRIRTWSPALREQVAGFVARYHAIADLLDGEPTRLAPGPGPILREWDALEVAGEHGVVLFAHRRLSPHRERTIRGARTWEVSIEDAGGVWVGVDRAPVPVQRPSAEGTGAPVPREEDAAVAVHQS